MKKELLLELKNVSASYEEVPIIHSINISIDEGEIIALMGPNGAGKSTVLKTIFGLLEHSGDIIYEGQKIHPYPHDLVKMGIAFVPQGRRVFATLSIEENLEIGGYFLNDKIECRRRIENIYELFPILRSRRKIKAGLLSGGQQQLVAIARGLMIEPKLLLLDEPTLGLAPKVVKEMFAMIKDINTRRKTAIIVVEHNLHSLLPMTDRAYVLSHGEIVYTGNGEETIKSDILERVFSGKI